jgi:DNA-binding CsgD family transcriptional regulator
MLRFAKTQIARGLVPGTPAGRRDQDTYDRHAGSLYRQAFLTVDDAEMAEQVVSDVIVEECVRPPAAVRGQDAGRRLAVSAYRRCMEVAGSPASASRSPARRTGDRAGSPGPGGLSARERGVLGLVIFGALGYRQVGVELGMSASEVSALLRAVLVKAEASEPDGVPHVNQERVWP